MGTTRHPRANRSRAWVGALLVAGFGHSLVTHAAAGDSDRIAVLEQKLDQSLQLIRELSARVHDLEARAPQDTPDTADQRSGPAAAAPGTAAPTPPDTAQRLAKVEQTVTDIAASAGQHAEEGMATHGFADVGVGNQWRGCPYNQGAEVAA